MASPAVALGGPTRRVRVLALVEAKYVTGPAKNLIEFACRARQSNSPLSADVSILTFQRGRGPLANDFISACRNVGLSVYAIRERFPFDASIIPPMLKIIQSCTPDIIQSHAVKSHFLVRLTGSHKTRPWIAFHHGYTWTSRRTRVYNLLDRYSLPAAHRVVTVCQPFARDLEKLGVRRERIAIQHNTANGLSPASDEEILKMRYGLGIAEDERIVLCVGRLSSEKGQSDLIRAVGLLRKAVDLQKTRIVFIGDGPDREILENLANGLFVRDFVRFTGQLANLRPYYSAASLVVIPSHTEGSPNVLLEAMVAGVPVIATSVGGIPEMVTGEKEALLVDPGNPTGMALAIERALGNAELRRYLAAAATDRCKTYSPAVYCESILNLYRSCLVAAGAD